MRNRHVKFYKTTQTNTSGGVVNWHSFFYSTLSYIEPQKSKEVIENLRLDAPSILKINIPFRTDILANMVVVVVSTNKLYEIVADPINIDMKNTCLDILLKESDTGLRFKSYVESGYVESGYVT